MLNVLQNLAELSTRLFCYILADRINGCAYRTTCRSFVCCRLSSSAAFCIVAKRYVSVVWRW